MEAQIDSTKLNFFERSLDFHFLLLILCVLVFANTIMIIFNSTSMLELTAALLSEQLPLGKVAVAFAAFCFLMAWALPLLRRLLQILLGYHIESLCLFLTNQKWVGLRKDSGWRTEYSVEKLALELKSAYLEKRLQTHRESCKNNEKGAKLAFSLSVLLIIDLTAALFIGGYNLSFVNIVGSMADQLSTILSRVLQLFLWLFASAILVYGLHPRSYEDYLHVPEGLLKAIKSNEEKEKT